MAVVAFVFDEGIGLEHKTFRYYSSMGGPQPFHLDRRWSAAFEGHKRFVVRPNTRDTVTCVDCSVEHGVSHLRKRPTPIVEDAVGGAGD